MSFKEFLVDIGGTVLAFVGTAAVLGAWIGIAVRVGKVIA